MAHSPSLPLGTTLLLTDHPKNRLVRWATVGLAAFLLSPIIVGLCHAESLSQMREGTDTKFSQSLDELASRCDQLDLPKQAEITRDWFIPRDPRRSYLFLPAVSDELRVLESEPLVKQQWYRRFRQLRDAQAENLFELAQKMLSADRADLTYQLLHETLHENPDHEEARRVLGYRMLDGQWRRPTGDIKVSAARTRHPDFHWPPGSHWQINSQHFRIVTNGDRQKAVELAAKLERLFDVWKQLYFEFWSNRESLARRFKNTTMARTSRKKHVVVLFRSRDEYNEALRDEFPGIEQSLGFYSSIRKESMLFDESDATPTIPTWRHEVTHQLFQESFRTPSRVGLDNNFWLVEGLAMYMESMVDHQRYMTVGGFDSQRLQFARYRLFDERFFVPLDTLATWGRDEFQRSEIVKKLYTESAGLTHFLMDGELGQYRQPLIVLARTVYTNRQQNDSLEKLTKTTFGDLDKAYQDFLRVRKDEIIRFLDDRREITQMALSFCEIDDEVLSRLAVLKNLKWLALSGTQITDQGLRHLEGMQALDQLFIEQTNISDAGMEPISKLVSLRELSIANSQVTDAGLPSLKTLRKLAVLNYEGCDIAPKTVDQLRIHLPNLQK